MTVYLFSFVTVMVMQKAKGEHEQVYEDELFYPQYTIVLCCWF